MRAEHYFRDYARKRRAEDPAYCERQRAYAHRQYHEKKTKELADEAKKLKISVDEVKEMKQAQWYAAVLKGNEKRKKANRKKASSASLRDLKKGEGQRLQYKAQSTIEKNNRATIMRNLEKKRDWLMGELDAADLDRKMEIWRLLSEVNQKLNARRDRKKRQSTHNAHHVSVCYTMSLPPNVKITTLYSNF